MPDTNMMLAKNLDRSKLKFPLVISEKIDGVAYMFAKNAGGIEHCSRQNKPLPGAMHIIPDLMHYLQEGDKVYGELYMPGESFKVTSGLVRRAGGCIDLFFGVYDFVPAGRENAPYSYRIGTIQSRLNMMLPASNIMATHRPVHVIPYSRAVTAEDVPGIKSRIAEGSEQETFEGWMYRSEEHKFQPGKRSWGMQREVLTPTIDLRVVSLEEAVSKDGERLGRVGRLNCYYPHTVDGKRRETIGVSAGRMTHITAERLWRDAENWLAEKPIVEVKFKPDPTYAALRQPTYQRTRYDKKTADV